MPLNTGDVSKTGGSGNSLHVRDGIFVEQVTIQEVRDYSGQEVPFGDWTNDLAVQVVFEGERERPFEPTYFVGGDFKEAADGSIEWGGAFLVARFLKTVLDKDFAMTEDNRIPKPVLKAIIGESFLKVAYTTGEENENGYAKTRDWNQVVTRNEDEELDVARERAADLFEQSYRESGYPKNYDPTAIGNDDEDDTSFDPEGEGWETSDEEDPWSAAEDNAAVKASDAGF